MTWTTFPTLRFCSLVFVAIRTPGSSVIGHRSSAPITENRLPMTLAFQCFRSTHDLRELLRNLSLASSIKRALQDVEHVGASVSRVFHRRTPGAVLGGRRLHQGAV